VVHDIFEEFEVFFDDGLDAVAAAHAMELAKQNHTAPFFPNAQISVSWGI